MDIRKVREEFARVKPHYLRGETLRALVCAITAFKEMGGVAPTTSELRGYIRETVQLLARDPQIKEAVKTPLVYTPGQEKLIYTQLIMAYKEIKEKVDQEAHEEILARKMRLDRCYNEGLRHLAQNRVSEADAAFTEALSNYKDEQRLFFLIGQALAEAGEVRRAYPYLKRGMEEAPDMQDMAELFEDVSKKREELSKKD